ncbi:hypothetical protein NOIMNB_NOIMNB_11215, partial [Dysosmobacter welbionis]
MRPFSSPLIRSAAGTFGSPGMAPHGTGPAGTPHLIQLGRPSPSSSRFCLRQNAWT